MNEAIANILRIAGIDPNQSVPTDGGIRTAFEILEGHVSAALDEITDTLDESNNPSS